MFLMKTRPIFELNLKKDDTKQSTKGRVRRETKKEEDANTHEQKGDEERQI